MKKSQTVTLVTCSNADSFSAAEATIKEGLVKAAKDTKAWLFTSGVDNVSIFAHPLSFIKV